MSKVKLLILAIVVIAIAVVAVSCASRTSLPIRQTYGPAPALPDAKPETIPTVQVAPAKPWAEGTRPMPAGDLAVNAFAGDFDHPRWLHVLPNGDVLVAETNAPERSESVRTGVKGWFMKRAMKKAGAATKSANRITLLRDADGDGVAETRHVFLANLNSPFGMALVGNTFYVANTDAVVSFPYVDGATSITAAGTRVHELPAGTLNHHWTKSLIASPDGSKLYATVGSNSNAAEMGMDRETDRAAIHEIDLATGRMRPFATGLRNPNGMGFEPVTGVLWTAVNERDEIGNDLVPDYMTSVVDGGFYGWPYSWYGRHVDERVKPQRPDLVATARVPDYALGAHTASLGLAFYTADALPARYHGGVFIGQHGSWNRKPPSGYKVVFVPFRDGKPAGETEDVLTGFLDDDGNARGRPVGVAVARDGALLVADDVGNVVWRLTAKR